MAVKTLIDHREELAKSEGEVLGFVDTKEQIDAITRALREAGYADSITITSQGDEGVQMLKRLQRKFSFGEGEDAIMKYSLKQLRAGHYALSIVAKDRDDAMRVAGLSEPLGAHSFSYFGTWASD